jgi:hypothetical protein
MNYPNKLISVIAIFGIIIIVGGMSYLAGLFDFDYHQYRDEFSVEFINKVDSPETTKSRLTYRITNNNWRDWEWLYYEVIHKSNGKIIYTTNYVDLEWTIDSGKQALLTVEVTKLPNVTSFELIIKDLRTSRKFSL